MQPRTDTSYAPRPVRFLGIEEAGGWRIKCYGIAEGTWYPRAELVDAGVSRAVEVLGAVGADQGAHGVAYLVAHDARNACVVSVDWWMRRHELWQRTFHAPVERPEEFVEVRDAPAATVWELAVTGYERAAWMRHVLTNQAGPDFGAYLDDAFEGLV
ncbi:hypothetical protein [Actinoalloteichus hymeniacidonis]|uniref:Uncharacterized protein n=1 Tax=Actinoalloteichus hymeniacidonis TaxID=340345 RepID=A0AAC9HNH1_9PSEU|nr:hypothetical protein [Actinoalloteichus hymeniacidonis]AOS62471.1 hypothetical protein TL08_08280 [Actinoalloteichus hymeniacidonis]MBB5909498.1 hypothetical protein [Actinoalloteichus hymeniacidonis]